MKKIIIGAFAFAGLVTVFVSALLNRIFLKTDKKKFGGDVREEDIKWLENTGYKDIYMISQDGFCLHAIMLENNSDNWVLLVHGYDSESRHMTGYARKYIEMGYSVLMPDQRGYGMSGDIITTMGHLEKNDMTEWLYKLTDEYGAENIVMHGVSMGAATVMLASAENIPDEVRCTVEDCGYTSSKEEFEYNIKHIVKLPPYPILWICDFLSRARYGYSILRDSDCVKAVRRSRVPICFIHGTSDTFVPYRMLGKLYEACPRKDKEILEVSGAEHTECCTKAPEIYWDTISSFIEKHFVR